MTSLAPAAAAMPPRLLTSLRERDVQSLATSKGVPSALVAQARRLLMQRRAGEGKP